MQDVNKQLLDALIAVRHELHRCQAVIHLAGGFDPAYVSRAKAAIIKADEAIAAAEQAQQAKPVARDWPGLLEMARQIIRDGHVHDVGGGDLAVTTCEAFEGLDAFLKKNFPEPLGELTGEERKWLEAEAAIQPLAVTVPDEIDCEDSPWMSADTEPDIAYRDGWNACRAAMLASAPKAADPIKHLIAMHNELLGEYPYCYFELAYTRRTDWMAWLCTKPREDDPERKVLACGQGLTAEEACAEAISATQKGGEA